VGHPFSPVCGCGIGHLVISSITATGEPGLSSTGACRACQSVQHTTLQAGRAVVLLRGRPREHRSGQQCYTAIEGPFFSVCWVLHLED
jgi:hypothetical protein